jgi:hypothetical protein
MACPYGVPPIISMIGLFGVPMAAAALFMALAACCGPRGRSRAQPRGVAANVAKAPGGGLESGDTEAAAAGDLGQLLGRAAPALASARLKSMQSCHLHRRRSSSPPPASFPSDHAPLAPRV